VGLIDNRKWKEKYGRTPTLLNWTDIVYYSWIFLLYKKKYHRETNSLSY